MIRSGLTIVERRIARFDGSDLGAGYPLGLCPAWASATSSDFLAHPASLAGSVRSVLEIGDSVDIHATLSGSLALQRAFMAARQYLARSGRSLACVTTDPCIDIIAAIAREMSCSEIVGVKFGLRTEFSDADCDRLCGAIRAASAFHAVIVAITSPENPTGATWTAPQLSRMVRECADTESVLIVDHCFILAGVHERRSVSPIWSVVDESSPVLAIWDTGKTIHLDHAKLGFVMTANRELSDRVGDAISVIQFGIPLWLETTVGGVISNSQFEPLLSSLRAASFENQQYIEHMAKAFGLAVHSPTAGTFGLIQLGERESTTGELGVPLSCFCLDTAGSEGWRRVALARPVATFKRAWDTLFAQS